MEKIFVIEYSELNEIKYSFQPTKKLARKVLDDILMNVDTEITGYYISEVNTISGSSNYDTTLRIFDGHTKQLLTGTTVSNTSTQEKIQENIVFLIKNYNKNKSIRSMFDL